MLDSCVDNEAYAKRAKELGHKVLSSVEHGYCGVPQDPYSLAKKYDLKFVCGAEAYWVKDRYENDRTNNHIILLAKSNFGREELNECLSVANEDGYYYRPRVDIELLLKLPKDDIMVTTACIAFNGYGMTRNEDGSFTYDFSQTDPIISQLHEHFGSNFYLEVQNHLSEKQATWNRHLLEIADKENIQLIAGLDSHYIYPEQKELRKLMLEDNKAKFKDNTTDDESEFYLDYPDDETVVKRFKEQGVLSDSQIKQAMDNTDLLLDFCDYDNVPVFTTDIKLPTLYPELTQDEKNTKFRHLVSGLFYDYIHDNHIPKERYQEYYDGVKEEIQVYEDTGMCDYYLLDYAIVKLARENGCYMTYTGRGSAVGFFTNTLAGFSKVDRFRSPVKLYPSRFMSTTRILQTKSLPDIDLNTGTREILADAQEQIMGKDHVYPMISFSTLKKKNAFKLYARIKGMKASLANEITKQMDAYDEAVKNADDDDKDSINIEDYIDPKYKQYLDDSQSYFGTINGKLAAPSAFLLYDRSIRREIGLIRCKSESSKKDYLCCVLDGKTADKFKFLKNDLLKVASWLLIPKVFERIGIPVFDINELQRKVANDDKTWEIYSKGITACINQVENEGTRRKVMEYAPKNVSELTAFIAAIRPGFKSLLPQFLAREDYCFNIPTLDNALRTEQLPVSFIFFQEQVMQVLNIAGIPLDECYTCIKNISKKHVDQVLALKDRFTDGMVKVLMEQEHRERKDAEETTAKIWQVIQDSSRYSFNAAHALSYCYDSLYQAWQKAHYPYEFYEVSMNHYCEKGNKDKVAELRVEAFKFFHISFAPLDFDTDHREFRADKEHNQIIPSLSYIKGFGKTLANQLWKLKCEHNPKGFIELIKVAPSTISKAIENLIKINFFRKFGNPNQLLYIKKVYDKYHDSKVLNKYQLNREVVKIVEQISTNITDKQYKGFDSTELVNRLIVKADDITTSRRECMGYELDVMGSLFTNYEDVDDTLYMVEEIGGYSKNVLTLFRIKTGETYKFKFKVYGRELPQVKDIIDVPEICNEFKWLKVDDDSKKGFHFEQSTTEKEDIVRKFTIVR